MRLAACAFVALAIGSTPAGAEVLVRWDQDQVPSPVSLGIGTIVLPAGKDAAIKDALSKGYRVLADVDAAAVDRAMTLDGLSGVLVRGSVAEAALQQLTRRLPVPGARVVRLDERGKWPHIRTNWVTLNDGVLQVTSRSAQPWIENNGALLRIARAERGSAPFLTYPWQPITPADADEGPAVENYLVAIAEAGSFGGNLLLPLHAQLQRALLAGEPAARADWERIRRSIEFYSWDLPQRREAVAEIGVVTSQPAATFEVMNLLARHNLPFRLLSPAAMAGADLSGLHLLLLFEELEASASTLAAFVRGGGILVRAAGTAGAGDRASAAPAAPWRLSPPVEKTPVFVRYAFGSGIVVERVTPIADPDAFAFEVRELLGADRRALDIWNGLTVIAAPYRDPQHRSVLVTMVNYAHQPLPVQVRVRGSFTDVLYESPEEPAARLPHRHRNGYTEVVVPSLVVGGRIFLSGQAAQ